MLENQEELRKQLVNLLLVQQAHMSLEDAAADFPEDSINIKPQNADYTFWHLLEHIRICQRDILDYITNPDYVAPEFPKGLWPGPQAETEMAGWYGSVEAFIKDRQMLVEIIRDPANDLYAQIPHGEPGHNILREILVVADHNAYHVGELAALRQVMRLWP